MADALALSSTEGLLVSIVEIAVVGWKLVSLLQRLTRVLR